jgi:inosine-uridine nucleoside N-ribohydrolase
VGEVSVVLDTDTYNEIDDQFAVVYSLLSPENLKVEAIYAAPFHNKRSDGPADGMEKSYQEILRLLSRMEEKSRRSPDGFVHRGSTSYLPAPDKPVESDAARDLIERAGARPGDPLYVVAIGAITNVASAILMEPEIIRRIVIVWLGGNPVHWPTAAEFNLRQDLHASRLVFDCGVPLVHIPCQGVTTHLRTTLPEMREHVKGRGAIGEYLHQIYAHYVADRPAQSKVIWDIAAVAWLIEAAWVPTDLVHSPVLTDQLTWSVDLSRHFVRTANMVHRDAIFGDFFAKLQSP